MRAPPFPAESSTPLTYAVLAVLSNCCPPPKGRLSTCYAPVRRFTWGRSPFLARLACVKPAANVRSEPGSNSPIILTGSSESREPLVPEFSSVLARTLLSLSPAIQFSETSSPLSQGEKQFTYSGREVNRFLQFFSGRGKRSLNIPTSLSSSFFLCSLPTRAILLNRPPLSSIIPGDRSR